MHLLPVVVRGFVHFGVPAIVGRSGRRFHLVRQAALVLHPVEVLVVHVVPSLRVQLGEVRVRAVSHGLRRVLDDNFSGGAWPIASRERLGHPEVLRGVRRRDGSDKASDGRSGPPQPKLAIARLIDRDLPPVPCCNRASCLSGGARPSASREGIVHPEVPQGALPWEACGGIPNYAVEEG
jgi:hypothetical protein